jgi:Cu(I)/Ag(I) efflux system membrane fusion protein
MHPEIVKDKPGRCDVCGMPLVKAESLGYVSAGEEDGEAPLVVPASAPLVTGTRAVVYVAVPGEEGTFAGRQVRLGPRSGDHYLVKEGLREGERVVVHGAFKIDSDLQIQAKPSMMNPEGGVTTPAHHHEPETEPLNSENHSKSPPHDPQAAVQEKSQDIPMMFARSIDAVAGHYFDIQYSLSSDDLPGAKKSAQALQKKLFTIDMNLLKGEVHRDWMKLEGKIRADSQKLAQAGDIEIARGHFEHLTAAITSAVGAFGSGNAPIYRFHCPMAFNNRGAYWLQKGSEPRNPYFGDSMLVCHDSMELLVTGEEDER